MASYKVAIHVTTQRWHSEVYTDQYGSHHRGSYCGLTPYGDVYTAGTTSLRKTLNLVTCVPCRRKIQAATQAKEKTTP